MSQTSEGTPNVSLKQAAEELGLQQALEQFEAQNSTGQDIMDYLLQVAHRSGAARRLLKRVEKLPKGTLEGESL